MLGKLLHPEKACSPILVTLLGIVTLVRLLQSENAYCPISVTPLFRTIFTIASLSEYQGGKCILEKKFIFPSPVMVRTPLSSRVQVRFAPQDPDELLDSSTSRPSTLSSANASVPYHGHEKVITSANTNSMIRKLFFILLLSRSLTFLSPISLFSSR